VSLLTELDAFFTDHHRCGDLDAGVEGSVVWMVCDCGAGIARRVDDDDRAAADLSWVPMAAARAGQTGGLTHDS
jgi:hypothetical protein